MQSTLSQTPTKLEITWTLSVGWSELKGYYSHSDFVQFISFEYIILSSQKYHIVIVIIIIIIMKIY